MAKRLNTFISDEAFRQLKVYAATHGLKVSHAIEQIVIYASQDPWLNPLPASGSRPGPSETERVAEASEQAPPAGNQSSREEKPSEIVECDVCGQPLPETALKLHRENCLRAKQGYWDQRAFRS